MEMCDRKYMFGDVYIWFKLEWSKMPKKGQQEEKKLCRLNKGQLPTLLM